MPGDTETMLTEHFHCCDHIIVIMYFLAALIWALANEEDSDGGRLGAKYQCIFLAGLLGRSYCVRSLYQNVKTIGVSGDTPPPDR